MEYVGTLLQKYVRKRQRNQYIQKLQKLFEKNVLIYLINSLSIDKI